MAFMAVLESDLRALSAEARRKYPAVKDAAEHAILKLRSLSNPSELAHNEDILHIFLMACEVKAVKLSVIGLSCLQKLISHNVVPLSAFGGILSTLKDHAEMTDETIQLKTLQTILIIFQSQLLPENEDSVAQALGICLRLLENSRSTDSVRNTAAATFRQAVALIFDYVIHMESLPASRAGLGNQVSRLSSVTEDVSRHINRSVDIDDDLFSNKASALRVNLTNAGKVGLRLLEDLTSLATGGSAIWLRVYSLHRTFVLEIIEFLLSNYVAMFQNLLSYEQVLQHQICSLLMTSLRTNAEFEGEAGEPSFRRLVLRSVAHVIRLYNLSLVTECEVFLNMLVKLTSLDLPLWHHILVLEILRGFCIEVRTLSLLFKNYDMNPKNTTIVENIVKALARVISNIQVPDSSEESLVAVAGMFSSKAKGIEWSLDNDASNAAVVVASEAHAITLAVEGLLGVVFTVAALTDEAVEIGEIESPRCDSTIPAKNMGQTAVLCITMINSMWFMILDALSLILTRSQGEAIVLEILKAYQAFTQACGVLHAVEPLNSFLASLCKFTLNIPGELEKKSYFVSALQSPGLKRSESLAERDIVVLTPKNVQALRTLFNVAHRLCNVLGPSWMLILDTLAALDRAINSPYATTQEVSTNVSRLPRETSGQYSDFHILSSLNSQLFESSALMHISAVKSLLSSLRQLSNQYICSNFGGSGQVSAQQSGNITFSVERTISIVVNNLHRVEVFWDEVVNHLLEVIHMSVTSSPQICSTALDALDQCICAIMGSGHFQNGHHRKHCAENKVEKLDTELRTFECAVIFPLTSLFLSSQNFDVRAGSLKILLHVLERHGEKLCYSWSRILDMLRIVADTSDKDLIPLGFQSVRVVMNDGLQTIPLHCLDIYIGVIGAYSGQKTEINISLTAVGLLWTAADIIAKGLVTIQTEERNTGSNLNHKESGEGENETHIPIEENNIMSAIDIPDRDKLLLTFSILQKLGADERPEVRNSAIRTLFQTLGSHGQKFSANMWESCLWDYVFPILDCVIRSAETSSRDEWHGKELGIRGGKTVHMLIHHSRNTAQKQWDETLVLVIGGITRILRSFFPFLQTLNNFWTGWEDLLVFIKKNISNGSKEVALAGVSCLQTTVISHCQKGNLPTPYLKSVLTVYDFVLQRFSEYSSAGTNKVKQEIVLGLGDIYVQAQTMFDHDMYLQLLEIINYAIRFSEDKTDMENGIVPPVHHAVLDILPLLQPNGQLSSMWFYLIKELTSYLPGFDPFLNEILPIPQASIEAESLESTSQEESEMIKVSKTSSEEAPVKINSDAYCGAATSFTSRNQIHLLHSVNTSTETATSRLFVQKLVPILVDLFELAPAVEKMNVFPDLIQGLGRCMTTRRDSPGAQLWRVAVEGFNRLLSNDVDLLRGDSKNKPNRNRLWKEVSDVYEIFLVGSCGRALSSEALSSSELQADELLEMSLLHVLGEKILKKQVDAPSDILQRLVSTLDRCASRTSCLPVVTVGLVPPHCSRFSLTCLQMIFSICSYSSANDSHSTRSEVSKIAVPVLMKRCEYILEQFLIDEKNLGELPLPTPRIDEIFYILQELARIVIHSDTVSVLPLQPYLKEGPSCKKSHYCRAHLFILFPTLCELITSREVRLREFVQVLLRLIAGELGLQNNSSCE